MNIGLFLNRDIYCSYALNRLVTCLREHQAFIFVSDTVGRAPSLEALDLLKLVEQDIPYDHVFPFIDQPGTLLSPGQIEARYDMPVRSMNWPNDATALEQLRRLELDVVVSIRYGRIFKNGFLELPRLGVLNLHSGILPDFRGVMASFHALAAGASEIGCTLHYVHDATIDTGDVVGEWRRPVDPARSYLGHVLSLYDPGARMVIDALTRLARCEKLERRPQRDGDGSYFSFPQEADVIRFEQHGFQLFHAAEYRALLNRYQLR